MFIVPMSRVSSLEQLNNKGNANSVVSPTASFSSILEKAYDNVREISEVSNKDAIDLSNGNIDNLHQIIINSERASTALEFAVQVTNKAVGAYSEIMRMQI